MVWHHQAKYSIWIGTACALSLSVPCCFLQSLFLLVMYYQKSPPEESFFFSFRVGTPLISKVEIITWSCSFCFFLYNFSSYPSIKKTKIQITTLLMENSTPPSPHSRKILSLSLLWVQMLLSSVSGGVALYNSAICSFLCMTCSPMG